MNKVSAKDKLDQAFTEYLSVQEQSLDALSVSSFAKISGIHRITFYENFESMLDFIKWFLHKDLIFKVEKDKPVLLEITLEMVFQYIVSHRLVLINIFASKYNVSVKEFIFQETLTYQLLNFSRIDQNNRIPEDHRKVYARFYSAGISQLIFDFIERPEYASYSVQQFTAMGMTLSKNYVEVLIAREKQG
jgi:hypothetical protein